MSGSITSDSVAISEKIRGLENASSNFDTGALGSIDGRTTIAANDGAQTAFTNAMEGHGLFVDTLSASARQLGEIRRSFESVDRAESNHFSGDVQMTT